ncbi:amino acid transporter [Aureobasidium sp. EXF-3400]|nr:amino acid transporter [Aureobasidium sp. EXF-12344]KAI4784840.1 amino acid transporter [Aureobasidium sp. EXF-3400]
MFYTARADSTTVKYTAHDPERLSVSVGDISDLGVRPVRRHFSKLNIVALSFNICNSWVAIAASLAIAVSAGGTATLIYGIPLATLAYAATGASLAEMASCYPTAGGQYHFASILAPKRLSRALSYACGSIAMFSWIALGAAATILATQMLLALVVYYQAGYVPQAWHYFVVYQAINVVFLLYNLFCLAKTPWVHNVGLLLTLASFVVITITCLVRSEKQDAAYVWATMESNTGYPAGVTFLTGFATPCFMFAGLDASLHLAEECTEPEKTVPKALCTTIAIGFVTGFIFAVAMCYGIKDLDSLISTTMPIYELWRQESGSAAATAFLAALLTINLFVINAVQQTSSHLIWAFGRDNGLVFSKHLGKMHPALQVPVWSLFANAGVVFIAGCIYLASTAAFNALINTTIILAMVSFAIPCLLLMCRGRSEKFLAKDRWFRMPNWLGWTCNATVVVFAIIELVFFDLPTSLPTTGSSMNYTCAVLAAMAVFSGINWVVYARKHYKGPRIDLAT